MKFITSLIFLFLSSSLIAQSGNALKDMINTERNFARTSVQKNTKEAFLHFMADDGIILRRGKISNGKQVWRERQADSSELSWYPDFADMAASGDMGFTSGPWQYKQKRGDKEAIAFGHFNTVWKKQTDGTWKAVIDLGISHPKLVNGRKYVSSPVFKSKAVTGKGKDALKASLMEVEKDFIQAVNADAYKKYMSPDIHVYRNGYPPYEFNSISRAIATYTSFTFELVGGDIASSGDIGYVYGNTNEQGSMHNYMRVWKRDKEGNWKVVLDVIGE